MDATALGGDLEWTGKRCSSIMIPIPERTCSWSCVAPNPEVIAKRSISLQLNLISLIFIILSAPQSMVVNAQRF